MKTIEDEHQSANPSGGRYGLAVIIAVPCCFALGALVRMIPYVKRIF